MINLAQNVMNRRWISPTLSDCLHHLFYMLCAAGSTGRLTQRQSKRRYASGCLVRCMTRIWFLGSTG